MRCTQKQITLKYKFKAQVARAPFAVEGNVNAEIQCD